MARKPAFSIDKIKALGVDKLAQIVYDETLRSPNFKKLTKAALHASLGADGVCKMIDRRLSGLKRAKSFIDWDRIGAFRDDLRTLSEIICVELASLSASMAVDRLLTFIKTHEQVYDRVDDSHGVIQNIYNGSMDRLENILAGLKSEELDLLPEKITKNLARDDFGFFNKAMRATCPRLSKETLRRWDFLLQQLYEKKKHEKSSSDWHSEYRLNSLEKGRQIIAYFSDDIDGVVAFEKNKHPNSQNYSGLAYYLFKKGQLEQALVWARKTSEKPINKEDEDYSAYSDNGYERENDCFVDEEYLLIPQTLRAAHVEAKILTALGDKEGAQKRRWHCFEARLSPEMLREYIENLDEFKEFEATDQAFAYVLNSENIYQALRFFIKWPKLDFASELVIKHHDKWDGGNYHILPNVAQTLQHEYILAATLLYRCLINNILERQRVKAYRHAATYITILFNLSTEADLQGASQNFYIPHKEYVAWLYEKHGKKTSFWNLHNIR